LVDKAILLNSILRPFGIEDLLLAPFLLGLGDGHKVNAATASFDDLFGNPFVIEPKMAVRLVKRRVDDRVADDDLLHRESSLMVMTTVAAFAG
jgi:hypothetical protein